ncbi:septal ring lytic transglycosylase RlpA family protein [Egibacter rhizosphaerae]|uniref:septal ring lytic transglycosylase RlpA family protein n=1 Tax=Egibacter rhizosphaerae TaxID=1670831 RepID=UPI0013F14C7D|nr:septal ring lytic transglycosylase RlpA family protein [Egibacter rhizosphaerae]
MTTRAAVIAAGALMVPVAATPVLADDEDEVVRLAAGNDRIETAIETSKAAGDDAREALLVHEDGYPDALAAGSVAGELDAPLLYTDGAGLDPRVADELDRLGTERVWVFGGPAAIDETVTDALADADLEVERIDGDTRVGTAAAAATELHDEIDTATLALGFSADDRPGWPDAGAAATFAGAGATPTLLSRHDSVPQVTLDALDELDVERVQLIGGQHVLADGVSDELERAGFDVERHSGETRAATAARVADRVLDGAAEDAEFTAVLVDGRAQPDVFLAGGLAARIGGTVLFSGRDQLSSHAEEALRRDRVTGATVVGGGLHSWVVDSASAAASGDDLPEPPDELVEEEPAEAEEEAEPEGPEVVDVVEGEASWYGDRFAGRPTASGEPYDPNALTAAMPPGTVAFGTWVRVTYLATDRSVEVRINDRGPYAGNRVIDLSRAAADTIGLRSAGTGQVRIEVLDGAP